MQNFNFFWFHLLFLLLALLWFRFKKNSKQWIALFTVRHCSGRRVTVHPGQIRQPIFSWINSFCCTMFSPIPLSLWPPSLPPTYKYRPKEHPKIIHFGLNQSFGLTSFIIKKILFLLSGGNSGNCLLSEVVSSLRSESILLRIFSLYSRSLLFLD